MSLSLPQPSDRYSYENEAEARRQIEAADRENLKTGRDITLQPGQRVILTSDGGFQFALTVADDGTLSASPA